MFGISWLVWFMADGWVRSASAATLVAVIAVALFSILHFILNMASIMEVI